MRILEVIDTLSMGGAQRVVERLARAAAHTPDVRISVATFSEPDDRLVHDALTSLGVEVHVRVPRTRGDLSDPTVPLHLARLARHHDLVHTHLGTANVLGAAAGRLARRPSVLTLHTVQPGGGERRVGSDLRSRAVDWALHSGATHVVAVGNAVRDAHAGRVGGRAVPVITNPAPEPAPIAADERAAARSDLGLSGHVLVAVGRLEAPKGLDHLLLAMNDLPADTTLVLAGEGSLDDQLRRQAEAVGIADRVRFLGNVDDVAGVLAAADVFVSSSIREGMPMAVLEAMARGLPVVATDVGDVRATVAGGGTIVDAADPDALAAAIGAMREPAVASRHGREALRLAGDVHGSGPWFARWCALWRAAIDGRPAPAQPPMPETSR